MDFLAFWVAGRTLAPQLAGLVAGFSFSEPGHLSHGLLGWGVIAWLAGWPIAPEEPWRRYSGWKMARPLAIVALLALLLSANLIFYTPMRLQMMRGLYGMQRSDLAPFLTPQAQELTPALIVVHPPNWMEYGVLLELQDPFLDTPFLFVFDRGPAADARLARVFPERTIYHYYPEDPGEFYTKRKK